MNLNCLMATTWTGQNYFIWKQPIPLYYGRCGGKTTRTTRFMPKSAIVCLFPYHVQHNGHTNLSRYTWSNRLSPGHRSCEYLERLIERLQIIDDSAQFSIHCDTSPLADRYMAYLAGFSAFTERTTVLSALNGVLMSLLVRFNNTRTQTKCLLLSSPV